MHKAFQDAAPRSSHIARLMDGPLDVVGDIHGEIDALRDLMGVLGYDEQGRHPAGRRLVFVGDLCDRGPDSVAVLACVAGLVERGRAQCVLGNHELNVMLGSPKEGNGWYFDQDHDRDEGKFLSSRRATGADRVWIDAFIGSLPVALEGPGLRVVHACWHAGAVQALLDAGENDIAGIYQAATRASDDELTRDGTFERAREEARVHHDALRDPGRRMQLLPALARKDEAHQMANPIRILTSGVERRTAVPFFSSGKWRMVGRAGWWHDYTDDTPVIVGHYWRWPMPVDRSTYGKGGEDLFAGTRMEDWLGPRGKVFCIDYSVGRRFQERERGQAFRTRLGAMQWPERRLVFDDGTRVDTRVP
ncbi:MAG: metallophosphoesterase [Luteibacter sp.]